MAKFKVGDKVRLVGDSNSVDGKARYYGKIATIASVGDYFGTYSYPYTLKEFTYSWRESEFEPVNEQKIVITTDGKTTTAKLYEGSKVIKTAEAKCNPEDKFDFNVGARMAFDRLSVKYKKGDRVKVVKNTCCHYSKIGDIITLTDIWKIEHGQVKWNYKEGCGYIIEQDIEPYIEPTKPNYYNGKVVCVKSGSKCFKVGKVYEFVDGRVIDEDGDNRPIAGRCYDPVVSLEDGWFTDHGFKFIPFVES